jgi:hypothetical protein
MRRVVCGGLVGVVLASMASCTVPLASGVQPLTARTRDQQELDVLACKDKTQLEAHDTGRQVGYFFLGMTLIGWPVAVAMDRSLQQRVFKECMESRGYKVLPPADGPQTTTTSAIRQD